MSESARPPEERPKARRDPRDAGSWAVGRSILRVSDAPEGAVNLNVDGRRVIGALQGFRQLWQKIYTVRLRGVDAIPRRLWPSGSESSPCLIRPRAGSILRSMAWRRAR